MIAVAMLLVSGIITPGEALNGFANEQIAVIFLLLLISDVIKSSGVLNALISRLFHADLSYRGFLFRMTSMVSIFSAWVNNTPLVAIMIPYTWQWASNKKISPSKVLIPLSYAAIIGGMVTLIGTSTNLVVNGLAVEASHLNPDIKPLHIFDFSYVGLPLSIVGLIYLWVLAPKLLPDRNDPLKEYEEHKREYLIETIIPENSGLIGGTVEDTLRHLGSLFLAEVVRDGKIIAPVQPNEILTGGDILIFAGNTETIAELVKNRQDIKLPDLAETDLPESGEMVEVVVAANSSLIGKTVKSTGFRGIYDSAIIAICRDGERLSGSIGEQELRSGDLLLLVTGHDFKPRIKDSNDFYTISGFSNISKPEKSKSIFIVGGTVLVFLLSAFTSLALFKGLLVLLILLAVTKTIDFDRIKSNLDAEMFLILALALAVGRAITNSGAATYFAHGLLSVVEIFNSPIAALFTIYLITNLLSMMVTNKAAVAISFPIAMAMVQEMRLGSFPDLSYTPFILAIAFAGCAEFITPFGYQTNLMVYGPGGYKFRDYVKIGIPLTLLYLISVILILGLIYDII